MSAKFTPGPWHVGDRGCDSVFLADGARLCTVMPRRDDPFRESIEDFANARLIAAAPDLFAACKEALIFTPPSHDPKTCDCVACAVTNRLRAAVALAEGGTAK